MNSKMALNTSVAVSLFRCSCRRHDDLKQNIIYIYNLSRTYDLIRISWEKIKLYFRYSLLGRITEKETKKIPVLDSSCVFRYSVNFYKKWKSRTGCYFKDSTTEEVIKETKEGFLISPLTIVGILIIVAVDVNVLLCFFLQRSISLWGWIIRSLFFFAGASALLPGADWPSVKENSIFFRKVSGE